MTTKDQILDVAERLFSEMGFEATSLRALTQEAGVNLAAVNYHFKSKNGLIEALFERRLAPMNLERLTRLRALQTHYRQQPLPLHELIRAFVQPALELASDKQHGGEQFMRLLGRSYTEPSELLKRSVRSLYGDVIKEFKPAFADALPFLDSSDLYWRLHFMVGALAYCMSGADLVRLISSSRLDGPIDMLAMTDRLVDFLQAGLESRPQQSVNR